MHTHGGSTIYFHNMESHCAGMHGGIHMNGWTRAAEGGSGPLNVHRHAGLRMAEGVSRFG